MIAKTPRIEKHLLIPLRVFISYRYVRESRYWGSSIRDAKRARGFMAVLAGYRAVKRAHGWDLIQWWLKAYDAPLDENSVYGKTGQPCEAVNPQMVVIEYFPERLEEPNVGAC